MRILYVGEIVGRPGIFVLKKLLPVLKKLYKPDLILGNADGATGGFGLGKNHAFYLHKLGLKGITGGDFFFYKKDLQEIMTANSFLLRPGNFPPQTLGPAFRILRVGEKSVGVMSLLGQGGFSKTHLPSPLGAMEEILKIHRRETPYWLVDFHGTTTAEKNTFFYGADGLVSAVIGSHQKVQTADPRILPLGTGVLTDAGRTGSQLSVGGFLPEVEIKKFLTGVPDRSLECWEGLELQGVLVDLDPLGKTTEIQTLKVPCEERPESSD